MPRAITVLYLLHLKGQLLIIACEVLHRTGSKDPGFVEEDTLGTEGNYRTSSDCHQTQL